MAGKCFWDQAVAGNPHANSPMIKSCLILCFM
jgi:hypothetical protein